MFISSLPFYLSFLMPISALVGLLLHGKFFFISSLISFVLLPLGDVLVGDDSQVLNHQWNQPKKESFYFDLPLILFIPFQITLLFMSASAFSSDQYLWWEKILIVINAALVGGGVGITIAHELCHRKEIWAQYLGKLLLLSVNYLHWADEHIYGHHRDVSTLDDPASARFGENFYQFLPRTLWGTWAKTWKREKIRQIKRRYFWQNPFCFYVLAPMFLALILFYFFGYKSSIFYYLQAFFSASLLELVNYVEHYGLSRHRNAQGQWSKVGPEHSWNSSHKISNYFLFHLQKHSDHHMHAHYPYQILSHLKDSPQLPSGYPLMILLALIPPLWKKVAHPLLLSRP